MKKYYAILRGEYSDRDVLAITENKGKAHRLAKLFSTPYDEPTIKEYYDRDGDEIWIMWRTDSFGENPVPSGSDLNRTGVLSYWKDEREIYGVYAEGGTIEEAEKNAKAIVREWESRDLHWWECDGYGNDPVLIDDVTEERVYSDHGKPQAVIVQSRDKAHAAKKAQDMLAQWKAGQEGIFVNTYIEWLPYYTDQQIKECQLIKQLIPEAMTIYPVSYDSYNHKRGCNVMDENGRIVLVYDSAAFYDCSEGTVSIDEALECELEEEK